MQHFIWRGVSTIILAAWLVFGGLASPAMAASVSFAALHYSADRFVPQFHFEGPVTEGDATALAALIDEFVECTPDLLDIAGSNCAVVTLSSPGGDYIEGLRLAALMRERAIATVVEANAECYSACAFAFLGGTGYARQEGIGAYIDRMIEPSGILGFHAPYFASEALDGLVAQFGMDDVLGASRDDVALMIQQLVDWNVNANALSYIASMGPTETYDIVEGEDYAMLWAQLPPAPLYYWNSNTADALRNACINLLAYHLDSWPSEVAAQVALDPETALANNEQGQPLSGFRLTADNPLAASYCALPNDQFDLNGDVDLALYTAPGVSGGARPLVSLFSRSEGWSTMGTGGDPTRRHMQKGSLSQLFVPIRGAVESDFVKFMDYLPLRKFARFNAISMIDDTVEFAVSELPMSLLGENTKVQVMLYGQQQVIVEAGSELLYATARQAHANRNDVDITLSVDYENGFAVGGYYFSGRPYLWVGLKGENGAAAVVRIETLEKPQDMNSALIEQEDIACSFALHGHGLDCS
ncbi:hypothetical protein [Devosia alba]|uniref:COG3904 family protein n=1 Tax=Devosia alba TaxID=3152360 RepID=UPI003265BD5D